MTQTRIEVYHLNETQTELLNDIVIEVKNAFVDDI